MRVAVQPDLTLHKNGERQSFSERWLERAAEVGIETRTVDLLAPDWLAQLGGCDALMWRFSVARPYKQLAMRLLPALDYGASMFVFPYGREVWQYDDKIAQAYLLPAAGFPMPRTVVSWSREAALAFCRTASYPFVLKLAHGNQSTNVTLVHGFEEAAHFVDRMFGSGLTALGYRLAPAHRMAWRRVRDAITLLGGGYPNAPSEHHELEHGYFVAQEFLPGNEFDTRVTIIGDRAYAFRRLNRPDDFRASGSGLRDHDPDRIDPRAVRMAFRIAARLGLNPVAIDVLRRGEELLIVELNLSFANFGPRDCPGQWLLQGDPDSGELVWQEGSLHPEDAMFDLFLARAEAAGLWRGYPRLGTA